MTSLDRAIAAQLGVPTDHSLAELRRRTEMADRQDWRCSWCEREITPEDIGGGRTNVDHIIPKAEGGPATAAWNKELLHAPCNSAKRHLMTPAAWALARERGVPVIGPDTGGLADALHQVLVRVRRVDMALATLKAAGVEPADDPEPMLAIVRDALDRIEAWASAGDDWSMGRDRRALHADRAAFFPHEAACNMTPSQAI